jgi:hypothetical protein
MTIRQVVTKIKANCDDVHCGRITWQQFSERQADYWRMIDRNEPCIPRSNCARRMDKAMKLLREN